MPCHHPVRHHQSTNHADYDDMVIVSAVLGAVVVPSSVVLDGDVAIEYVVVDTNVPS